MLSPSPSQADPKGLRLKVHDLGVIWIPLLTPHPSSLSFCMKETQHLQVPEASGGVERGRVWGPRHSDSIISVALSSEPGTRASGL